MKIQLPEEIVCLILVFDGSLVTAIRKQYMACVYINVYREAFGWYFMRHHANRALEMAKYVHRTKPWAIKRRRSRMYMKPWRRAFGKKIEIYLYKFGMWKRAMKTDIPEHEIQRTVIEQLSVYS